MNLSNDDKVAVLINQLNERYNSAHRMRERSLKFSIWIMGFAVALIWILLKGEALTPFQKTVLTIIVGICTLASFWFLLSIQKGFGKNKELMIDLEKALGLFKEGEYVESKVLFPSDYKKKKKSLWSHFHSIYFLLFPVSILLIILIWISPGKKIEKNQREKQTQKTSIQKKADTTETEKAKGGK